MAGIVLHAAWLTSGRDQFLVVGPSLGTSASLLWQPVADLLPREVGVLAWDLPGHAGTPTGESFTIADLAAAVVAVVDTHIGAHASFSYAGDSVGAAVGLQLLLDAPSRVANAALLSTGARIGEPAGWLERAAAVRRGGVAVVVDGSMQRWFSTATTRRRPDLLDEFTRALLDVDPGGYAEVCCALAGFDVRHRLSDIGTPLLAIAGAGDQVTPPSSLAAIADGVRHGRLVVLDNVAHLPPVEAPHEVAALLVAHLAVIPGLR